MVDVRKDATKPQNVAAFAVIILALVLLLFGGRFLSRAIPGQKKLEAVLFVTTQQMRPGQGVASSSVAVEKFCDDHGIERRRLLAGQSTRNAEPWLERMSVAGNKNPPSFVFYFSNGQIETIPIPNGADSTIRAIEARQ